MALPTTRAERDKEAFKENSIDGGVDRRACITNGPSNPVPVEIVEDGAGGDVTNIFNQVTNVASGSPTTITSYTVPIGKVFFLKGINASGSNRAKFTVKIGGSSESIKRTYQPIFNVKFDFFNLKVSAGVTILVEVEHDRSSVNEFDSNIMGNLV